MSIIFLLTMLTVQSSGNYKGIKSLENKKRITGGTTSFRYVTTLSKIIGQLDFWINPCKIFGDI